MHYDQTACAAFVSCVTIIRLVYQFNLVIFIAFIMIKIRVIDIRGVYFVSA